VAEQQSHTLEGLLKRAYLAMYQAKAAGKNDIRFFDPEMQAVMSASVALKVEFRQSLGLEVTAEGVETREQLAFLAENGCYAYQGYLFSRPLPIAQFEALLGEHYSLKSEA
jgi:EAL domain-containing protein (putative c-di-GMP-specific phosphodiesterase class I)